MKYYKQLDEVLKYHNIIPLTIQYENLVKKPLDEINKVYKRVGLSELNSFSGIFIPKDYHIVGGNGLRYKDKVTIKEDSSWQHRLTDFEKSNIKKIYENGKIV